MNTGAKSIIIYRASFLSRPHLSIPLVFLFSPCYLSLWPDFHGSLLSLRLLWSPDEQPAALGPLVWPHTYHSCCFDCLSPEKYLVGKLFHVVSGMSYMFGLGIKPEKYDNESASRNMLNGQIIHRCNCFWFVPFYWCQGVYTVHFNLKEVMKIMY